MGAIAALASPVACSGDEDGGLPPVNDTGVVPADTPVVDTGPAEDGASGDVALDVDAGCNPVACAGALQPGPCQRAICDPLTVQCALADKAVGAPCDDGDACTVVDSCDDAGQCVGSARDCDDDDDCTADTCTAEDGCQHTVTPDVACDDGSLCTTGEICSAAGECVGQAKDCGDQDPCTEDSCAAADGSCLHEVKVDAGCDDGDACTQGDRCSASGACHGTAKDCSDQEPCTVDSCDDTGACQHVIDVAITCDDGNACSSDDHCQADGSCGGTVKDCGDGDDCTDDFCNEDSAECFHFVNAENACDDDDPCTLDDACTTNGECLGTDKVCEDDDPCTNNLCNGGSGLCVFVLDTTLLCDDADPCTQQDRCQPNGLCVGLPGGCDDDDPCTIDSCADGGGACVTAPRCSDDDPCTEDLCDGSGTCGFPDKPSGAACDDGNPCTDSSTCDNGGACSGPVTVLCPADAICEAGACDAASGECVYGPKCADDDPCTEDLCDEASGACSFPKPCDDSDLCTVDSCDAVTGACAYEPACSDDDICTANVCDAATGACGTTPACDDEDPCTDDVCDPATGGCTSTVAPGNPCDDDDPCTADECDGAGACIGTSIVGCTAIYDTNFPCETADWTLLLQLGDVGWKVDGTPEPPAFRSQPCSLNLNADGGGYGASDGSRVAATATSPAIGGSGETTVFLSYWSWWETADGPGSERPDKDQRGVRLLTGLGFSEVVDLPQVHTPYNEGEWTFHVVELTSLTSGEPFRVQFWFDTRDGEFNEGRGWFIDDLLVDITPPELTVEVCDSNVDEDLDGNVSCEDPDCSGDPTCFETGYCGDGVDQDGDNLTDCEDDDCADDTACAEALACGDTVDNDLDNLTDCEDGDCSDFPACAPSGDTCAQGVEVGGLPYASPTLSTLDLTSRYGVSGLACPGLPFPSGGGPGSGAPEAVFAFSPPTTANYTITAIPDGWDAVLYVLADCAAPETNCLGGRDAGLTNQAESVTLTLNALTTYYLIVDGFSVTDAGNGGPFALEITQAGEGLCDDNIDNDVDNFTDCDDDECAGAAPCVPEGPCDDALDGDGDGATDCDDAECAEACVEAGRCGDAIDNDQDGLTDCADTADCSVSDCIAEICEGGVDDDGDNLTDCEDDECAADIACIDPGESCAKPASITVPADTSGATCVRTDDVAMGESPRCQAGGQGVPDTVYAMTVPTAMGVEVTLTSTAALLLNVTTQCGQPASGCVTGTAVDGGTAKVAFPAVPGTTYYLVVDGVDPATPPSCGSFELALAQLTDEGDYCDDGVDNDGDGPYDCEEAACAGHPACTIVGDTCAAAVPMTLGMPEAAQTTGAADVLSLGAMCGGLPASLGAGAADSVFRYTAAERGWYRFELLPEAGFDDPALYLRETCDAPATCLGASDDATAPAVTTLLDPGETAHAIVDGATAGAEGSYTLELERLGDACFAAPAIEGFPFNDYGNTVWTTNRYTVDGSSCAVSDFLDPIGLNSRDAAYVLTTDVDLVVTASLYLGVTSYDASLYVVTSCGDTDATCLAASNVPASFGGETVTFTTTAGTPHYLIIDGPAGNGEEVGLFFISVDASEAGNCFGGVDDDGDGATDCADSDCATAPVCDCGSAADCEDGNPCTADSCTAGICAYDAVVCNDGNPCTKDVCVQGQGCSATPMDDCGVPLPYTTAFDCLASDWGLAIVTGQVGWGIDALPDPPAWQSASCSLNFNDDTNSYASFNVPSHATATSPVMDAAGVAALWLTYSDYWDTQDVPGGIYDQRGVRVSNDGITWTELGSGHAVESYATWTDRTYDLSAFAGGPVLVEFWFDTFDPFDNAGAGWFIDDLTVSPTAP